MTYIITKLQRINEKYEAVVRSDLSCIVDYLSNHYKIDTKKLNLLEIGTHVGESTFYFSKFFKHVFTVDCYFYWDFYPNREHVFLNGLKYTDNISKIKLTSEKASNFFRNKSIDFLYIDGEHRYQDIINDFLSWYPKVKDDGFIGGHDYFRPEEINKENSSWSTKVTGVFEFIDEFLGDPELVCNTNWLFKKEKIINKNIVQKIKGKQIVNNLTKNRVIINSSPPRIHK